MIILPDKNIPRAKFLMPVPKKEWMPPSQAQRKTVLGHEDRVMFRITAKSKGRIVWKGWFEDREDFDIFLHSIATGNIKYDKFVWTLPVPMWDPGIGTDVVYEFATTATLSSTTQTTWTRPSDWNNANNDVYCVGGGGSGGVGNRNTNVNLTASGGGGGGFGRYTNLVLTGNPTYQCGTGGTAVSTGDQNGNAGAATYFNGASYAAASVGGDLGGAGLTGVGTASGGAGGAGKGTYSSSGGRGGNATSNSSARCGSGGGGAAGPNGNGNQGVDVTVTANVGGSDGGSGDAGLGGTAGIGSTTANGGGGGNGTEWNTIIGSGGGGGGATGGALVRSAGSGGNYGAGGGGCATGTTSAGGTPTSGAGIQGYIFISYNPFTISTNMPMLGM